MAENLFEAVAEALDCHRVFLVARRRKKTSERHRGRAGGGGRAGRPEIIDNSFESANSCRAAK